MLVAVDEVDQAVVGSIQVIARADRTALKLMNPLARALPQAIRHVHVNTMVTQHELARIMRRASCSLVSEVFR